MFNEEANIASTVEAIEDVMSALGKPWELILVNDGSTDNTHDVAEKICAEKPYARLL